MNITQVKKYCLPIGAKKQNKPLGKALEKQTQKQDEALKSLSFPNKIEGLK